MIKNLGRYKNDKQMHNKYIYIYIYRNLIKIALAVICVMAFIPFLSAARFAVFSGDDFSFYNSVQEQSGDSYFVRCIQDAALTYMTWQGTYLANLTNTLFNPLQWYSYGMLRVILMGCLVLSFSALCWLSAEINALFNLGKKSVFIFALLLLPVLAYREYTEVYLWFVGTMAYQVPVIFLILGFASLCRNTRTGKKGWAVAAGVCFFLVGGGPLNIGGITAWFLLLILTVDFIEEKRLNKTFLAMFLVVFFGDIINVVAPGNYVRNEGIGGLNVFGALSSSLRVAAEEYVYLFTGTGFIIFFIFSYVLGAYAHCRVSRKQLLIAVIALCITPCVALFPHMLGYNITDATLAALSYSDRTLFVVDVAAFISLEAIAFLLGSNVSAYIGGKLGNRLTSGLKILVAVFMVCVAALTAVKSVPVQISENLINGKIEEYNAQWHEMYDVLRDSPGQDVVFIEIPEPCAGTYSVAYGAYPSHAANTNWAQYFGNNSVCTGWYVYTQENPES